LVAMITTTNPFPLVVQAVPKSMGLLCPENPGLPDALVGFHRPTGLPTKSQPTSVLAPLPGSSHQLVGMVDFIQGTEE
jgi:hypothetical protein